MARSDYGDGRGFGDDRLHVTETPDVRHIGNPDVMHEESDVNVRGVGTFVGVLAAAMIVVCLLMWGVYWAFERQIRSEEAREARSPMARTEEERRPPPGVPRLQSAPGFVSLDPPHQSFELQHPQAEWEALREKWERELNQPPDPAKGETHLTIEEAKRRFLSQQLPVRPAPQAGGQHPTGIDIPSYSSAGRQPEKRDR